MDLTIGEVAKRSGVKIPTIRYYEQIGLLPPAPRTDANRRRYSDAETHRLGFIHHARELGFDIEAIRTLLTLQDNPDQSCETADIIARARLTEIERRIASLTALKSELEAMVESCRHGILADCRVIEVLSDHDKCLHPQH
jgi:DNA-binding transcriptional MerR regulator